MGQKSTTIEIRERRRKEKRKKEAKKETYIYTSYIYTKRKERRGCAVRLRLTPLTA